MMNYNPSVHYWNVTRPWSEVPYGVNDRQSEMLRAIKDSNIPDDFKFAILGKMTTYDSYHMERNNFLHEVILRTMAEVGRPMRVSEFTFGDCENMIENPDAPLSEWTVQCVSAHLRQLFSCGLVKREEVETGRVIRLENGKEVKEKFAYFSLL